MPIMLIAAQTVAAPTVAVPSSPPTSALAPTPIPAIGVVIPKDTPVELMAPTEVSTAKAKPGTLFKLRVAKPVEIDGRIVVPVGTPAFGRVVSATDAGGLGRSGHMTAKLVAIRLDDIEIPLEGGTSAQGTGAGSAALAVLFTGPMGLFHRGNDAKIKAGETLTGFVSRDTTVPVSAFVPRSAR